MVAWWSCVKQGVRVLCIKPATLRAWLKDTKQQQHKRRRVKGSSDVQVSHSYLPVKSKDPGIPAANCLPERLTREMVPVAQCLARGTLEQYTPTVYTPAWKEGDHKPYCLNNWETTEPQLRRELLLTREPPQVPRHQQRLNHRKVSLRRAIPGLPSSSSPHKSKVKKQNVFSPPQVLLIFYRCLQGKLLYFRFHKNQCSWDTRANSFVYIYYRKTSRISMSILWEVAASPSRCLYFFFPWINLEPFFYILFYTAIVLNFVICKSVRPSKRMITSLQFCLLESLVVPPLPLPTSVQYFTYIVLVIMPHACLCFYQSSGSQPP